MRERGVAGKRQVDLHLCLVRYRNRRSEVLLAKQREIKKR